MCVPEACDVRIELIPLDRVLLEKFDLSSEPMLRDVKTLTQKAPTSVSLHTMRWRRQGYVGGLRGKEDLEWNTHHIKMKKCFSY